MNDLSQEQWVEMLVVFGYRCAYCPLDCRDCRYKRHELTQDHVTPYAHHGSHTLWNVVPACESCNKSKWMKGVPAPVQPMLLTISKPKPVLARA
jgi:5-methylcytosine-specific restriction endonuclease McrA